MGLPCLQVLTDFELFVFRKKCKIRLLGRWKYLDVSELWPIIIHCVVGKNKAF
jgi:hypothetical protein